MIHETDPVRIVRPLLLGALLLLMGCTTTAFLTGERARSSGYEDGVGVRVETVRSEGTIRPRADLKVTNQKKLDASDGYTYSGSLGAQWHGRALFLEAGWIAYGYESTFGGNDCKRTHPVRPCTVWAKDESSPYLRVGMDHDDLLVALRYVPPSDDTYKSDTVTLESRWQWRRLALSLEPSVYRMTLNNDRTTGASLTVGIGLVW